MGTTINKQQTLQRPLSDGPDKWCGDFDDKENQDLEQTCRLSEIKSCRLSKPILASKNIMKIQLQPVSSPNPKNKGICSINRFFTNNSEQNQGLLIIPIFDSVMANSKTNKHNYASIEIDPKKFITTRTDPILKQYAFYKVIGKGSFGVVYKAESLHNRGELRAIKKIQKEKMNAKEKLGIINEFEILKQLDHPNIIKLYQIFEDAKNYYVVFEYCSGGDLLDYLNQNNLSESEIKMAMVQILSAVKYMHSLNILHRDLKLENIVAVKKKQKGKLQIKIIDFGLAIDLTKKERPVTNKCAGTLIYMSPETLTGQFTLSSDMWSCGIILYILVTKRVPYEYSSDDQIVEKIVKGYISRRHMHRMDLTLKMLINFLVQPDQKRRYTAGKALKSEWFKKASAFDQGLPPEEIKKAAQGLLNYKNKIQNNLLTMVESYLAFKKISQNQRQRMANLFREINTKRSGVIDLAELKKFYEEYSENYVEKQVQDLMRLIDKNKSGKIDFNEFVCVLFDRHKLFSYKNLQQVFNYLDVDKSGHVCKEELKTALQGIQDEEIEYLLGQLDSDQDSLISKGEFISFIQKHHDI